MTVNECARALLSHYAPEERSIPDSSSYPGRNASILEALNGALQECYAAGSPWVRWDERGSYLPEPREVHVIVAAGVAAMTSTGAALGQPRCTVKLDGQEEENRQASRAVGSPAVAALKLPAVTTGTVKAAIYGDALELPDDVLTVVGPVRVGGVEIPPRSDIDAIARNPDDYGAHQEMLPLPAYRPTVAQTIGRPLSYRVETFSPGPMLAPRLVLRVFPAPSRQMAVEYRAMLRPPVLADITATDPLPVPFAYTQTIFLPIARQKLTASPFFRAGTGAGEEIARAYQTAMSLLKSLLPADQGITFRSRY